MSHCGTCSCGTVEYGVTFSSGVREGEIYGPLTTVQIMNWNRSHTLNVVLLIRVRPETEWRHATEDEIREWNRMMARGYFA